MLEGTSRKQRAKTFLIPNLLVGKTHFSINHVSARVPTVVCLLWDLSDVFQHVQDDMSQTFLIRTKFSFTDVSLLVGTEVSI
jgi:hypothetical protein